MIPKKIHYCWFGGNPLSDQVKKYIDTWKKYCPDYEIIEWNESNFDIAANNYCREAYEARKWAFVSDYARLKVLYEYGGIYMDTDVEVIRPYDSLLDIKVFCCFEDDKNVSIGTLGAEKGNVILKELLNIYDLRNFKLQDGKLDLTTNLKIVTNYLIEKYNLLANGCFQELKDKVYIYPREYFIAKDYKTGELNITENTYSIHHYDGSWMDDASKLYKNKYIEYWNRLKIIPKEFRGYLVSVITEWTVSGLRGVINKIIDRILRKK